MRILLSFTGFHDPFTDTALAGDSRAGPVLTVVAERPFDKVCLFSTPRLAAQAAETAAAIRERHAGIEVEVVDVPLTDPTDYLAILTQLRRQFRKLAATHPEAAYAVSVSSGTPHMHASWILLAASGEIPARILQCDPPQFVPEGKSPVREIDITAPQFPQITRPATERSRAPADEDARIAAGCRELGIVGEDPAFLKALREAYIYAQYDDVHVLLLGETGTGKEYFARFIHQLGGRSDKPLVTVNCGSIPENLVESDLFGHKRGAFTGAVADREGKFKAADGGIIFLDELGELPLSAQAKLLRVLEEGEIEPVGATRLQRIDVKVVAATNRHLAEMVAAGEFREDLYQRFGSSLRIPRLRERRLDIPKLALHLLTRWNARHKHQRRLSVDAIETLMAHPWPGNVRELRKVVTQSAMLVGGKVIRSGDLRFDDLSGGQRSGAMPEPEEGFVLPAFLDDTKHALIQRALEKSAGVQSRAARLLGITPQAVSQHLKHRALQ